MFGKGFAKRAPGRGVAFLVVRERHLTLVLPILCLRLAGGSSTLTFPPVDRGSVVLRRDRGKKCPRDFSATFPRESIGILDYAHGERHRRARRPQMGTAR